MYQIYPNNLLYMYLYLIDPYYLFYPDLWSVKLIYLVYLFNLSIQSAESAVSIIGLVYGKIPTGNHGFLP